MRSSGVAKNRGATGRQLRQHCVGSRLVARNGGSTVMYLDEICRRHQPIPSRVTDAHVVRACRHRQEKAVTEPTQPGRMSFVAVDTNITTSRLHVTPAPHRHKEKSVTREAVCHMEEQARHTDVCE